MFFQKSSLSGWDTDGWRAVYPPNRLVRLGGEKDDDDEDGNGGEEGSGIKSREREILTCSDRQQFSAAIFNMYDHQSLVSRTSSDGLDREVTGYTYFKASTPKYVGERAKRRANHTLCIGRRRVA